MSGTRWIEVMHRLSAARPEVVVPGHNEIGSPQLLADVTQYLTED